MRKIEVLVFLFFVIISQSLFSQSYESFFSGKYENNDSARFVLTIDNTNFLKNNEYFSDFYEGYTLIGYFLRPRVVFKPYKNLNIYAGLHLQKYSGVKQFTDIEPLFTVEYKPTSKFSLLFGELQGSINHELTDFVLDNEYYLTQNSENGVQFLFNGERIKSDTWIDWKQYIFKDSPYPEILLFGTSNKLNLLNINKKHPLSIKLAAVASHVGGQINSSDDPVETIINTIAGIEYNHIIDLYNIKFSSLFHTSTDASPNKRLPYTSGYGILSGIELANKFLSLKLEHWYGEHYFSKFGNPMYQSISQRFESHAENERAFLNVHLFWVHEHYEYFKLGAGVDIYNDLFNKKTDYSFGLYIKTNFDFLLKK